MTTHDAILSAADELFGDRGYDATSVRDIAAQSGVNKALIHYHFGSKDELFEAVLDRYYDQLASEIGGALSKSEDLDEGFARLIDAYVDFLAQHSGFCRIVQREAAGGRHMERVVARSLAVFERGLELAKSRYPATRQGDLAAEQLLISFYGMIVSYVSYAPLLEKLLGSDPLSAQNLARRKRHLRRMLSLVTSALAEGKGSRK
jgi:AcrR family transcriptional regulator